MDYEKITKLVQLVSESVLTGFELEEDGTKLVLKKEPSAGTGKVKKDSAAALEKEVQICEEPERPEKAAESREPVSEALSKEPDEVVASPLVGTFYAAPSEGAEPFVRAGDPVKKGQTLAIVEAMKLMNEIESEYDGTVAAVLVENGQVVEYGQPLFRISR